MKFDLHGKRVYVAGHRGMVGSALVRRLAREDCQILTASRGEVDLRNQQAVDRWFDEHRPDAVFLAAARVGGIYANNAQPGDFLYDNLTLQTNLIEAARRVQVAKLLFFGSSCIYPRLAPSADVFYPFFLDGVALNPRLNQADGMHPNPAGEKIIVKRMLPYVLKLVH